MGIQGLWGEGVKDTIGFLIVDWVGSDVAGFFQLVLDGEMRGIKERRSRR